MALNKSQKAIITKRREMVSQLRLRGLTQRAIAKALAQQGLLNPDTQKPFDVSQINRDLKVLNKEWQRNAKKSTDEHKARQYAELQALKQKAWTDNNLPVVLNTTKAEMDLLGTREPERKEVNAKHTWLSVDGDDFEAA